MVVLCPFVCKTIKRRVAVNNLTPDSDVPIRVCVCVLLIKGSERAREEIGPRGMPVECYFSSSDLDDGAKGRTESEWNE